jgi:hypothetical protein
MPFKSKAQMRAAFGGYLGKKMQGRAKKWADETPNIEDLPEHKKKLSSKMRMAVAKKYLAKHKA